MSSPYQGQSGSADADDRSNRMSLDITPNLPQLASASHPTPRQHQSPYSAATLLQDHLSHLPALTQLPQSEVIVLLTHQAIPITHDLNDLSDPFETLGRAISERHAKVRHVPFTNRNGITSTHVGFIKRASVLVMVITDLNQRVRPTPEGEEDVSEPEEREEEILQVRFAAVARAAFANYGDRERPRERPFILIVTCPLSETTRRILQYNFGTVICSQGYSKPALESAAALMFAEIGTYASTSRVGHQEGGPDHGPGAGGPPQAGQQLNTLNLQVTRPPDPVRSPITSQPITTQTTPNPDLRSESTALIQPRNHFEWQPEQWDEDQDLVPVYALWNQTMDPRFKISSATQLASLLNRTGYARHYVIRSPGPKDATVESPRNHQVAVGQILGFAATYLTYMDQEGEKLLGSLAILLVDPLFQNKGIGSSLHDYAINQLKDTMGVRRLQLGSLWPRILFGPPCGPRSRYGDALAAETEMEEQERILRWLGKRGWPIAPLSSSPARNQDIGLGQGKAVHDLILLLASWKPITTPPASAPPSRRASTSPKAKKQKVLPSPQEKLSNERAEKIRLMRSQITFRSCTQADMASVLGLVDEAADVEGDNLGWYDQYSRLSNEIYVKDIIIATTTSSASSSGLLNPVDKNGKGTKNGLGVGIGVGVERTRLVGCALTYTPSGGNPVAGDLPWAGMGGVGVGADVGGVCCVCVSSVVDRESLMIGLLDACVQHLHNQGMKKLFLDTVRNHLEWFEELGFVEWARYRDVWKDIEPDGDEDGDQDMDT